MPASTGDAQAGTVTGMHGDRLLDEIEGEAADLQRLERDAEIADRTRSELSSVTWLDRVRGMTARRVVLALASGAQLAGQVRYVGPDWVLLDVRGSEVLVPSHAVVGVEGATRSAPAATELVPVTWAAAWRSLSRDRAVVRVVRRDASTVRGLVGMVGADFVELDRQGDGDVSTPSLLVPFGCLLSAQVLSDPAV